ncbi:receptor kinase-like protein Xa21 isoform X2 [Miscanthus floridulus]|uniref:receptor kinase-like protein Xa21 isoform X2 n=1 Tax=Miscanthus floridulus TaxID=154761 RepID=UPI00345A6743
MCPSKQQARLAIPVLTLLLLLLLCYGVGNVHCSTIRQNRIDLQALLDFKQGVSDPSGALSNWSSSSHFCRWNGVTCTRTRPYRLRWLNLTGQSLSGQISSSLSNLTFLNFLDLSNNNFVGPLPPLLGRLRQLQFLWLEQNSLSGNIPDALANCSNLTSLDISSNVLEGSIPPKLGTLANLTYLSLHSNQLEGSIPGELGQLVNLKSLLLNNNNLSGEVPHAIFSLSSLQYLYLHFNFLGKALPSNIGELLPNLIEFTLENNTFEGPIPASLGNALGLQTLDLSSNNFTGKIPTSFGKLSNLTFLNLQLNRLIARNNQDWEFFNALRNCRYLRVLSLSYNDLQGSLPSSIGNLSSSLETLLLGGNSLAGQVPQSIGKLSALTTLGLGNNYFSGTIEGWVENLRSLRVLNLRYNDFTGPILSNISNLTQLLYLYLDKNGFEGPIPARLGNLQHLLELNLSYNNFEGYIPPNFGNIQGLILLDLSHNNLQGDITLDIRKLKQLADLRLSSNKISGEIPETFGECQQLENLQMNENYLIGNIPTSFKGLLSLETLNLSHNNLSGTIPTFLKDLSLLDKLDLSYNYLQGEIPTNGVFANATAVSLMNNWGLCGGVRDLHMPVCPAVTWGTKWKRHWIIISTLVFAFISLGMSIYIIFLGKKTSRRPYLLLLSFGKNFPRVSYNDIAQVTRNFSESNLIGKGSYGSVYRGKLNQAKIQVAIKVFDLNIRFADRSFVSECEALRTIRHRNLLPVLSACSTIDNNGNEFKALIYEFMASGNLDTWLHQKHGGVGVAPKGLGLAQRISICVDVADALAYLHHDCGRPIVHCDLKPTNILLDDDMNAHLGDFGIASLVVDSTGQSGCSSSLAVTGTIGYIAPEYAQTVHATTYGDVYSFGVVLLEMLIGKRPTDPMFEGELSIISFVERKFPDQVLDIIDAHVQEECKGFNKVTVGAENEAYRCVLSLLQVALACTLRLPSERMSLREVAINLHAIKKSYILSCSCGSSHLTRPRK